MESAEAISEGGHMVATAIAVLLNLGLAALLCLMITRSTIKGNRYNNLVREYERKIEDLKSREMDLNDRSIDIANTKKWLDRTVESWKNRNETLNAERMRLDAAVRIFDSKVKAAKITITSDEIEKEVANG